MLAKSWASACIFSASESQWVAVKGCVAVRYSVWSKASYNAAYLLKKTSCACLVTSTTDCFIPLCSTNWWHIVSTYLHRKGERGWLSFSPSFFFASTHIPGPIYFSRCYTYTCMYIYLSSWSGSTHVFLSRKTALQELQVAILYGILTSMYGFLVCKNVCRGQIIAKRYACLAWFLVTWVLWLNCKQLHT